MNSSTKKVQLFMLHFAGGNVFSYQFLKPYLPNYFDFHPLELPGRGKRIKEKLLSTEFEAIEDLLSQITLLRSSQPYLIFGHSMGAFLGLKLTKRLEQLGDPPKRLIVAGNAGPGAENDYVFRSTMNDDELKEELKTLGGVTDEILNNHELFSFFAPIMRSDFRLLENKKELESDFKISTSITAIMGHQEESSEKIENWRKYTSNEFRFHILSGNHFFIYDHPSSLIQIINNSYDRSLVS